MRSSNSFFGSLQSSFTITKGGVAEKSLPCSGLAVLGRTTGRPKGIWKLLLGLPEDWYSKAPFLYPRRLLELVWRHGCAACEWQEEGLCIRSEEAGSDPGNVSWLREMDTERGVTSSRRAENPGPRVADSFPKRENLYRQRRPAQQCCPTESGRRTYKCEPHGSGHQPVFIAKM